MEKNELLYKRKSAFDTLSDDVKKLSDEYAEGYKQYLDKSKTEREAVSYSIKLAEAAGFVPYKRGASITPGAKFYTQASEGKGLMLAVIGKKSLSDGTNIAAAHVDSPRLDLKQVPLYEDGDLAFFKTHYYGGIKKYQWVARPLALHGVVVLKDGKRVNIVIGEDETDPIFMVTDLLPHLGKDQEKKSVADVFTGENLNILIGSRPTGEEKETDRIKHTVMSILNEKYGITEEDFMSAELEAVPQMNARDLGLDRSMIAAYGHDDRSCSYAALRAICDINGPERTAVCVLADKEEVGSESISGMQSAVFDDFMDELCTAANVRLRDCYKNSFCLSADVCNAFDPNFPEVSEKQNAAKFNFGIGVLKHTGSRGKAGSSEASAETVAMLRNLFSNAGVVWQMSELGKVDQGGGGTVAKYMAMRNIETIDAGVPVLSMHAPYEIVAKLDCYMTYKAAKTIYEMR